MIFGVLFWLCSPSGLAIWGSTTLLSCGLLVGSWIMVAFASLYLSLKMAILLRFFPGARTRLRSPRSRDRLLKLMWNRGRLEDRLGDIEADTAADLGRRHQSEAVMDARRVLVNAREFWYPIVLQLHRFHGCCFTGLYYYGGVALLPIPESGIRAVASSSVGLTLGSTLILLCFPAILVS